MEAWSYCLLTYRKKYSYLFSTFTDTKPKFNKIAFGDGILACMSRDFGIFMLKHLAEQWVLDSYKYSIKAQSYCPVNSSFAPIRTKIGYTE